MAACTADNNHEAHNNKFVAMSHGRLMMKLVRRATRMRHDAVTNDNRHAPPERANILGMSHGKQVAKHARTLLISARIFVIAGNSTNAHFLPCVPSAAAGNTLSIYAHNVHRIVVTTLDT